MNPILSYLYTIYEASTLSILMYINDEDEDDENKNKDENEDNNIKQSLIVRDKGIKFLWVQNMFDFSIIQFCIPSESKQKALEILGVLSGHFGITLFIQGFYLFL